MLLFDRHAYGRDYGGRGMGERPYGAWNRFDDRLRGAMRGGGYDRGMLYGDPHGTDVTGTRWSRNADNRARGYDAMDFAYRGTEGAWSTAFNRGAHDVQWDWRAAGGNAYDQDLGPRYDRDFQRRRAEYDRGYGGGGMRERGRMDVDVGDPYGDRQGRTPFRVMRGGFDSERAERWYGRDRLNQLGPDRYDVDYRGWNRGIGDEPAYRAEDVRGWDRGRGRDYGRR